MVTWWLAGGLVAVAWAGIRPIWMWRLRTLKGPQRLPFVGNILQVSMAPHDGNMTEWLEAMARKHGPVFVFWTGGTPLVCITDPALGRSVMLQHNTRGPFEMYTALVGVDHSVQFRSILNIHPPDPKFKAVRKAYEAAVLYPAALAQHAPMLSECTTRLTNVLATYAASGAPLNAVRVMSAMTLDAIGFVTFGLDFACCEAGALARDPTATWADAGAGAGGGGGAGGQPEEKKKEKTAKGGRPWWEAAPGSAEFAQGLVEVCRHIVVTLDPGSGSLWKILPILIPETYQLNRFLANLLPDPCLKSELKARHGLHMALKVLIKEWKAHKAEAGAEAAAAGDTAAAATTTSASTAAAISDQGFLARLLRSAGEDGIDDMDIMAQALTAVLAGYETTAATLAAAVYELAQHPEAQARAQEEMDLVLQGKVAAPDDLERLPFTCAIFDEALRLHPPGDATLRVAAHDIPLDGGRKFIPKDALVWVNFFAMQRDPAIWPRALDFLPQRWVQPGNEGLAPSNPQAYTPFGLGPRMCVGYKFAQMEGRLALARVLQSFTFAPATGKGCPPMSFNSGIVYSPRHAWVCVEARKTRA